MQIMQQIHDETMRIHLGRDRTADVQKLGTYPSDNTV